LASTWCGSGGKVSRKWSSYTKGEKTGGRGISRGKLDNEQRAQGIGL